VNNISVLIVEDEPIWLKKLELTLDEIGCTIAASFSDVAEAITQLDKLSFDIALLDIRMNGVNAGISIGNMIHKLYNKPFIFITSGNDKETVEEAIAAKPSAFLMKPVNDYSLYAAIQLALQNHALNTPAASLTEQNNHEHFFVKTGNGYKKISWSHVVALAVEDRYTKVITQNVQDVLLIGSRLAKTIQVILPKHLQPAFVQISRTHFINIQHIQQLKEHTIYTAHQSFIVSDNFLQNLKHSLPII
jgi:DNA-binding LytR/AlgR family response regulator